MFSLIRGLPLDLPCLAGQAEAASASADAEAASQTQTCQGVNAEHWAAVAEAKQKILANPLFADIASAQPLSIGSGGQMAGWSTDTMRETFKAQNAYGPVAFNMWRINYNWVPIPGVVVNRAQVANWANHQLQTPPKTFPLTLTGAKQAGLYGKTELAP